MKVVQKPGKLIHLKIFMVWCFVCSQIQSDLMAECGNNENFGYSRCSDECLEYVNSYCYCTVMCALIFRCDRIARSIDQHLATCTYHINRLNMYFEDTPFCPYPPSVSINSLNDSKPLDFMSYFVDERLMEIAEIEDTVQFFRKYMAGFVISKHESAVSHCGVNVDPIVNNDPYNLDVTLSDLMCLMITTTPVVRNESLFADSIGRQNIMNPPQCYVSRELNTPLTYDSAISCSVSAELIPEYQRQFTAKYPNCNNTVLNRIMLLLNASTTNVMMIDNDFEVDGGIRQASDLYPVNGDQLVGRVYTPYSSTGAIVYYNNQVMIPWYVLKSIEYYFLLLSLFTCLLLH